jgi:hypothetical protein
MNDGLIYAVKLQDVSYTYVALTATSGSIDIDYSAGPFQQINTSGSVSLSFSNWPAAGSAGTVRVALNITNTAYTVTLPASVSQGIVGIGGVSPGTPGVSNTITFSAVGNYAFEFVTVDGGANIWIFDDSRSPGKINTQLNITNTTASGNTTTGALTVAGGVGISGNLNVGGNIVGNITVTGVNTSGNISGNVLTGNSGIIPVLTVNQLRSDDSSFVTVVDGLDIKGDIVFSGNISPAAANKVGGISPGPGVVISDAGQLTIDTAGLPLSFGDFTANVNQLSMVNDNEDMYLVAKGTGNINLIGGVDFYKPNGFPPSTEPFFRVNSDGQVRILVPAEDPIEGGVEIIGSASGNYIAPGAPGAMLQITGNPGIPTRLYMDGNAEYASFVARRYNGNVAAPTQVLAGEDVLRINSTAATNLGGGNVGNVAMAQIRTTALENQTSTAQGSSITFTVTPIGSAATSRVDVATITTANGVSATRLTSSNPTGGIGYIAGAGGTVTQLTSKATGVTLNTVSGEITTSNSNLNGDATVSFTLTNSAIANTDVMIINHVSGGTVGRYVFNAACGTGSAAITIRNVTAGGGGNEAAALVLRFVVIKGSVT